MLSDRHAGDAERLGKLIAGNLERSGPWSIARAWLWKRHRARGVERDVALNLLHDLMNVAIQHGHRTEAFEITHCLIGITRAPAPCFVNRPQRHMREDDN